MAIEGDTLVTQELVIRKMTKSGWVKTYPPPQGDYDERIEKMEKALSEEMAKVREMDDILAGVVKRVGYVSEEPSEVLVCAPGASVADPMAELIKWLDAQAALCIEGLDQASKEDDFDAKMQMEAMIDAYKAVKAHIEG